MGIAVFGLGVEVIGGDMEPVPSPGDLFKASNGEKSIVGRCTCYDDQPNWSGWPDAAVCGAHRLTEDGRQMGGLLYNVESGWIDSGTLYRKRVAEVFLDLKQANTDGRTTCFKCGRPLKIVPGFGAKFNHCPSCEP